MNKPNFGDIQFDKTTLYREENYTDLKVGSIQKLIPVKEDGSIDAARTPRFMVRTQMMSQYGPLPISAPVEVETLAEAIEQFPQAVEAAVEKMVADAEAMQREQASRIVVPGRDAAGPDLKLV
jgi:hypothetical protein